VIVKLAAILGDPEHKFLSIFACDIWTEYRALEPDLSTILELDRSGNVAINLKKLTILNVFALSHIDFPFNQLLSKLTLSDSFNLKSLTIDFLSPNLLNAKNNEQ
jgi:hypothetical protein